MKSKPKHHPSGLLLSQFQIYKKGTKSLGRVSLLCLKHWEESKKLKQQLKELQSQNELLKTLIKN